MLSLNGRTSKIGFTVDGEGAVGAWGNATASLSFVGGTSAPPDMVASWSLEHLSDAGEPPAHLRDSLAIPGVGEALARSPAEDLIVLWPLEKLPDRGIDDPVVAVFIVCRPRKFDALQRILQLAQAFPDMRYTISARAFFELVDHQRRDAVHIMQFDQWIERKGAVFASANLELSTSTRADASVDELIVPHLRVIRRWIVAAVVVGALSLLLQLITRA